MLGILYNAIGVINVTENVNNNTIAIKGINGHNLDYDVSKHWGTSKIYAHIMRKSTSYGFEFDNFFAVDILYIFETLANKAQRLRGSRRQYAAVAQELKRSTWLRKIDSQFTPQLDYSALQRLTVTLYEHQERFLNVYDKITQAYNLKGYILGAAPGSGKALTDDTLVKVPGGWKKIGELKVGDLVATPKGTYTTVTGVFPQGTVNIYEAEYSDGRKSRSCGEHLWKYHDHNASKDQEWRVDNTLKLIERLSLKGNRLYLPLPDVVGDVHVEQPVGGIYVGRLVGKISNGEETINGMSDYVDSRKAGVVWTSAKDVVLPDTYLQGTPVQRRHVLHGIMDQCAKVLENNSASLNTQSLKFAQQVQSLVWSLGGIAKMTVNGDVYNINIRIQWLANLFTDRDKQIKAEDHATESTLRLGIKSIKKLRKGKATCISVADEDKLFIIKDYLVTHNTITGIALSECLNTDTTFYIVPKNSVDRVWCATLDSIYKKPVRYWSSSFGDSENRDPKNIVLKPGFRHYVAHYEQISNVLEFVKSNPGKFGRVNIVIDESHNFNDLKSARTEMLVELVGASKSISTIYSSGTPVKAMGSEVIPIMRCIDSYFNKFVEERFKKVFGMSTSKALDILANRMGLITFKVDKIKVVGNQVDTYELDVKMPTAQDYTLDKIKGVMAKFIEERMKWYRDNMRKFLDDYAEGLRIFSATLKTRQELEDFATYKRYAAILNSGYDSKIHIQEAMYCNQYEKKRIMPILPSGVKERFKDAKSVYKYYHLKVQGEALGRILGRLRTQCSVEMAKAMDVYTIRKGSLPLSGQEMGMADIINQGAKKTVIFTSYVEVVDTLYEALTSKGFKPLRVYGDTNKNLAAMIEQFDKDPDLNPCIATFPSLSTAVPLIMANQGFMHNAPFRIHEYEQATARMDRLGQTEIVNIFNLYLDTGNLVNISTRSVDIMEWSKAQVNAIMGIDNETVAMESLSWDETNHNEVDIIAELALESCAAGDEYYINSTRVRAKERALGW